MAHRLLLSCGLACLLSAQGLMAQVPHTSNAASPPANSVIMVPPAVGSASGSYSSCTAPPLEVSEESSSSFWVSPLNGHSSVSSS